MNNTEEQRYVNIDVEKIRNLIKENKIAESSISSLIGYSESYMYTAYKNGKMNAKAYNNLCDLLGADYSELSVDKEEIYHTSTVNTTKFNNETIKILGSKLKKYLKANKVRQDNLSTQLGYTYNYIGGCLKSNKMNIDTYTNMCNILNVAKSTFIRYDYTDRMAEKIQENYKLNGRKYAKDLVKVDINALKTAVTSANINVVEFSVSNGYGRDYLGKVLRGYTDKISLAVLENLCDLGDIDINTILIDGNKTSVVEQPITENIIDSSTTITNITSKSEPKTEIKPKTETTISEIKSEINSKMNIAKYPKLILTGNNGESQEKLLVDKDEFIALNNELTELLNIVDGVFNQVNRVQVTINEIINKSS
jgi:transcriptional regulator with XRE-family HTH domain